MGILIIDDDVGVSKMLGLRLRSAGYDVTAACSATEGMALLNEGEAQLHSFPVELILMDVFMPGVSGIQACRAIKQNPELSDIPVIMLTASTDPKDLEAAFDAGAMDFVSKPYKKMELLARIRSALRLKQEIDERKRNEQALREANIKLEKLSAVDGLTGLYNRRHFDEVLLKEHLRAERYQHPLSLIMIDIDHFKEYNDILGHLAGDDCLKRVSDAFQRVVHRSHDLVARYGGEEFAVILPETTQASATRLARALLNRVQGLQIHHPGKQGIGLVTASMGVAGLVPQRGASPENLISAADQALYRSKVEGRNRVTAADSRLFHCPS